jgi:predicted aldo/keto reductase-like oxidoreductase
MSLKNPVIEGPSSSVSQGPAKTLLLTDTKQMQYRTIPKTGEKLSILGYGCMRLPTRAGRIDKESALRQIRTAIDRGVNYLDTAYPYHLGASETFLGEHVLTDGYREKVNITTKLPPFMVRKPEDMERILNRQLEKLRVEQIDYYLLHGIEGTTWKKLLGLGVIDFMDRIRSDGRVRNLGFSFHGTREDFFTIIDVYDWEFCQVQFNMLDENFQAGLEGINYAAERKIGVVVMEPLRGGQLVGKIPAEVESLWKQAPAQRSPAEWALRWIWNNPHVQVVLSGMNRDEHVEENIRAASESVPGCLTKQELAIIDQVKETYQDLLKIGCTGCRYCMPCPAGIDITYAFQCYNNYHMFGKLMAQMMYAQVVAINTDKPRWTSNPGRTSFVLPPKAIEREIHWLET